MNKIKNYPKRPSLFSNSKNDVNYTTSNKSVNLKLVLENDEKNDASFKLKSSINCLKKPVKKYKSINVNNTYINYKFNLTNSKYNPYNYKSNKNNYIINSSMENKNIELFNPLNDDNRYTCNELSRSFKTNFNPEKNELFVSLFNEFDEGKDTNKNKIKYKNVKKNIKEIKTKFYFIISILY